MAKVTYSNDYIEKTKAVSGCFSMFLLMVAITYIPALFKDYNEIISREIALPVLYATEFIILVPLYFLFFSKRAGLGMGIFNVKTFLLLLMLILLLQFISPWLLGINKTEEWVVSQVTLEHYYFWLANFPLVFIVPVYEEIVFRGCLFNTFKYWFNENVYLSAIPVSILFSILHTQYSDIRTLFILFLVSMVLILARVKSNGILMPIVLHMMMNMIIIGTQYAFIFFFN
ncbi:CPBP family intramembrane metalloprotease [Salmonella enterica]|uniref:CPBP family intramembrane glutamic endopeptidase n=1 Tax=Escherichia coli TaxID=562 RepID=UPI00127107AD|nr:CPBP family intramembrane metalloprotease [Salmonella enterica]EBS0087855.1 CPBP family intramembrane metalloprotease [Salmonella enterica subsp. enterica serovar Muenster]EDP9449619.1 CPBP family intramembrane metalloprotease [Salmonella enterica subsp. enterica]EDU6311460.1 CPBP family intramembrane metalloprotease [Salmonella enterica subsp. diarizonae serovar 53:z10:z]EHP7187396.1 CPBP family intramembrane metalloprotease [Salmonella enterica subsp. enterica serovar Thompson]